MRHQTVLSMRKFDHHRLLVRFMSLALFLGSIQVFTSCENGTDGMPEGDLARPNVLFISVDDLNTWLGCLGGHPNAKTPNMDKLASEGVLFSNAHCQAPLCGPSRASLMTGLRPSTTGIYGMILDDTIRSENPATKDIIFLPEYFRNHGYHTMGIGKLFHSHAPDGVFDESGGRVKGFDPLPEERFVWDGFGTSDREHYGRTSTDWGAYPAADSLMPDHQSTDWVVDRLNRKYDQPFFLALGFLRPHVPLYVPQKWLDMHPIEEIKVTPYRSDDLDDVPPVALQINDLPMMPSTEWAIESGEWKNIIQAYLACVTFVDHQIGRVMEVLKNSEYADNTVIVLWSDHGYHLGEKFHCRKSTLWQESLRVPLLIKSSGNPNYPAGDVVVRNVSTLDLAPTVLELAGLPPFIQFDGLPLHNPLNPNPVEAYEYQETLAGIVTRAETRLSVEQQQLFQLHHLENHSICDIAKSLHKSEDSIKSNLYRARKILLAR